ncbi:MAG TPA: hypothetical protein VKQ30_24170 [Ktedonobacterales bacterium]|nr:hypothetical protein [Ktedonobacterales bacterium]
MSHQATGAVAAPLTAIRSRWQFWEGTQFPTDKYFHLLEKRWHDPPPRRVRQHNTLIIRAAAE